MNDTELTLMAAAASIGERSKPKDGYKILYKPLMITFTAFSEGSTVP